MNKPEPILDAVLAVLLVAFPVVLVAGLVAILGTLLWEWVA